MDTERKRRLYAVLFIWAALMAAVFGGRMYTTDVLAQYEVAGSFIGQRQLMTVSGDFGWTVQGVRPGLFVPHGAGFSILLVPAAASGAIMGLEAGKVTAAFINSVFSLVLAGYWYASARKKYGQVTPGRFIMVVIGSMALVYSKITFDVMAAAAFMMAAYFYSLERKMLLTGALFGFAILIRLDCVLFFPLFLSGWKNLRTVALGAAPFLALILFLNWFRFGSPFLDGHGQDPATFFEPFNGGIPGLLLSPGKGLLYYAPLCFFSLFHQKEWKLWLPFVLSVVFHGFMHDWTGGTGWGPRFLFTSLPFLLLPLSVSGTGGKLFWVVAMAGLVVSLPALWSNPSVIEQSAGADLFDEVSRQGVIWTYSSSPLLLAFRNIATGTPDIFGATAAGAAGLPAAAGAAVQLVVCALLGAFGIRLLRGREPKETD